MAKKIVNIQIRLEYDDVDIFGEELHVADIVDEFTYCLEHSDWDVFENATIEKVWQGPGDAPRIAIL